MRVPALVTRLVGLWILAGGVLKLLFGTPADLPDVLHDLPLPLGTVFQVAIAVEILVGGLALLRPSLGWLPAKVLTLAFLVVLSTQIAGGESSCGCFGAALMISPIVMLIIDGVLFALLVLVKPWRLKAGEREFPFAVVAPVLLLAATMPWLLDRQGTTSDPGGSGLRRWVQLDVASWRGQPLAETTLYPLLPPPLGDGSMNEGIVVIWRASCEVCAEHLEVLRAVEQGQRPVILLQLPAESDDETVVVKVLPEGAWVIRKELPSDRIWIVTPPAHVVVEDGVVTTALEGHEVVEHK
ncbi:MAG: hypothetical protein O2894_07245 [Planctomycetota bacterium]|nr:hypothetical protein [Planctomycetota bacterium]